jgi:hypothetical protein
MPQKIIIPDPASVFLNVPYDRGYQRIFITLVAGLVALGRTPRCVLEVQDLSEARLGRIINLLRECEVSIHDLSRPAGRLNMPFELGLACALSQLKHEHKFIIFETKRHRANRTLSDLGGFDPHIHQGTTVGMVRCVFSAFGSKNNSVDFSAVIKLDEYLWKYAQQLIKQRKLPDVFDRAVYFKLVEQATNLAKKEKMIP